MVGKLGKPTGKRNIENIVRTAEWDWVKITRTFPTVGAAREAGYTKDPGQVNGQPKVRGKFKGIRRTANFGWEYREYEWAAIVPKKKTARSGRRRGYAFQERDNIEERTQGETQVPRSHRAPEEGDQGG